jgi:hypothetical protein
MKRFRRLVVLLVMAVAAPMLASGASATTSGTWTAYPGQKTVYQTQVKQPVNASPPYSVFGSSNTSNSVIPVKFGLLAGLGPFVFESICSDNPGCGPIGGTTANDFSYLSFAPDAAIVFNDLSELRAVYTFTLGDCHGGSLRWQVRVDSNGNNVIDPYDPVSNPGGDKAVFIYYGLPPAFGNGGVNGCTPSSSAGASQSGLNLLDPSQQGVLRFDTSQFNGIFYNGYAGAQSVAGSYRVWRASLVLDSGWGGDQRLTLGDTTVNGNTFTPPSSSPLKSTCNLPPAQIRVTKQPDTNPPDLAPAFSIQPADTNGWFRIVDCKYMYNLATSSLLGPGLYKVEAVINGEAVDGAAYFWLK